MNASACDKVPRWTPGTFCSFLLHEERYRDSVFKLSFTSFFYILFAVWQIQTLSKKSKV